MPDRAAALAELARRTFDVLVIGAGITGAGVARDAELRGLTVALIDKSDVASGTSSRSSRLIHGGVRYLEHGHLRLVFEASAERRRLLALAPHLVRPLAFTWPVYTGQRLPVWKLSAGLALYDLLALFRNVERHRRLSAAGVLTLEPALNRRQLRGGVRYHDAATDDVRLTLANVLDARRLGAVVANHVAYLGMSGDAARVEDALTGDRFEIRARIRVNATGPWSDQTDALEGGTPARRVQGSKGAHIAVERARIGNRDALTLLHPRDGRVLFTLPSGTHTIIGTTDTFTDVAPDEVRATETDIAYLLEAANVFFPDAQLHRSDVVSAWAGIRPLLPSGGDAASASREHAVERRSPASVAVTGGKLTTYRVMATDVVDLIEDMLDRKRRPPLTDSRPLPESRAEPDGGPPVVEGLEYRMSQIRHGVAHELACTLGDLLIRRTHVAFETRDNGRSAARRVAEVVAPMLGWDAARIQRELSRYDAEVSRVFGIES